MDERSPDANAVTLHSYHAAADIWLNDMKRAGAWFEVIQLINEMADLLPSGASVLEVGSARGDEADVMESHGLHVQRSDATPAFVGYLHAAGKVAVALNVLTDDLGGPWDAIFANAVFLHVDRPSFRLVLEKTFSATKDPGLLIFTLKEGVGSAWVTNKLDQPLHFTYWGEEELVAFLEASPWTLHSMRYVDGEVDQWFFCICVKR